MLQKIAAALCCIWLTTVCEAFEVSFHPREPKGGEGVLVSIAGGSGDRFEVGFNGKRYAPFPSPDGKHEIFLPLEIEGGGRKTVRVRRLDVSSAEERVIPLEVRERVKRTYQLKTGDEKMRDRQRMDAKQNTLVLDTLRSRSEERSWDTGFLLPLDRPVTVGFAVHRKGQTYAYYHKGLDFGAPKGTPVRAVNSGKVILNEKDLNVYGNTMIIDHGQGVTSCYFHLDRMLKSAGETVTKGDVIAEVGSSGWATGPHLHLGVYLQGEAVDPLWWIAFTGELARNRDRSEVTTVVLEE